MDNFPDCLQAVRNGSRHNLSFPKLYQAIDTIEAHILQPFASTCGTEYSNKDFGGLFNNLQLDLIPNIHIPWRMGLRQLSVFSENFL